MGKHKPYHDDFRFKKVGGVFYVIYKTDPAHPRSTRIPVSEGESAAVNWAYANMHRPREQSISLRQLAVDFFIPGKCTWTNRKLIKARRNNREAFAPSYLGVNRGRLVNYILPRFGSVPLHMITAKAIDEWLLNLDSVRFGLPLSTSSLDKILNAMRKILGEAKYQGQLRENVAADVEPYDAWTGHRREAFMVAELRELFPVELNRALEIWQSLDWYAFFLMMRTCGLRPQEVAGFMLSDWMKDYHGAVISRRIVRDKKALRVVEGLKTANSGMTVKPVVFSDHLERILALLEERGAPANDLLFRSVNGKPIGAETSNKHFGYSARRAGVELEGRTQYSLRHSFYTELLKHLPEKDVEKMAGHKSLRKEYDHRKGVDFLKAAQPMRDVINQISA